MWEDVTLMAPYIVVFLVLYASAYALIIYELILVYILPLTRKRKVIHRNYDIVKLVLLIFVSVFLIFYFAYFSFYSGLGSLPSIFQYVGIAVLIFGEGFRAWSILILGKYFSPLVEIQVNHRLITKGPYKYARHPSYGGGLIAFVGLSLTSLSIFSAVAVPLIVYFAYSVRMGNEERELEREFGKEYLDYKLRTKRMIPFII